MIKLLRLNQKLCFSILPVFEKGVLVVEKMKSMRSKKSFPNLFKKNIRPIWLIISLPIYQKPASNPLVRTFEELKIISAIDS